MRNRILKEARANWGKPDHLATFGRACDSIESGILLLKQSAKESKDQNDPEFTKMIEGVFIPGIDSFLRTIPLRGRSKPRRKRRSKSA